MNVLIVTAHPASHGFTHKIAARYKKEKEEYGHDVFVIDLYKKKYMQPFLDFENMKDTKPSAKHRDIQEKIAWADELVFVFPVWWFGPPAVLKNFFDQNFTSGFAYKYNAHGIRRELLEGRSARMFATADGPWWVYQLFRISSYLRWRAGVFGFCGVELLSFDIFSEMFKRKGEDDRERMLRRVAERARAYAPLNTKKNMPIKKTKTRAKAAKK